MPNWAWPGLVTMTPGARPAPIARKRSRARTAQRSVRCIEARTSAASAGSARHSSSTMDTSDPSCAWMSAAFSGVSRCDDPSRCDLEARALLVDRPARRQAEHLIAAAVGQDRTRPARERVQPAAPRDQVVAGPQIQMVGVAQENLGAQVFEIAVGHALDGALRAHGHEGRRFDRPVRRGHHAAARGAVAMGHLKGKRHVLSLVE